MIAAVFSIIFWIFAFVIALAIIGSVLCLLARAIDAVSNQAPAAPPPAWPSAAPRATPEDLARIAALVKLGQEQARRDRENDAA
jgi:hypothetical protein